MRVSATYHGEHTLLLSTNTREERNTLARWWLEEGRERFATWAHTTKMHDSWGEPSHEDD